MRSASIPMTSLAPRPGRHALTAMALGSSPPMRHTSFHSSGRTGWTESREVRTSAMSASFGLALAAARVTGLRHIAHGAHVDALPGARVVLGVGMRRRAHLDDADDLLALARVIEKAEVAQLHGDHVVARHEVAHARPTARPSCPSPSASPRSALGLGLEQPVGGPGLGGDGSAPAALKRPWLFWASGAPGSQGNVVSRSRKAGTLALPCEPLPFGEAA